MRNPMLLTEFTKTEATSPLIFVGGAGRSGTTLVRVILDSHSRIACGPELKITPLIANLCTDMQTKYAEYLQPFHIGAAEINQLFGDFIEKLLTPLKVKERAVRVAEKTPNNVFIFPHLHRMLPESCFIHVVRDGRDVVTSLLQMNWLDPEGHPIPYTKDPVLAARYWAEAIRAGRHFQQSTDGKSNYHEVRYEDLVLKPEATLQTLFAFLGEPWEPDVLNFHQKTRVLGNESSVGQVTQALYDRSVARWKNDLNDSVRSAIKAEIGPLLIELGYADNLDW